MAQLNKRDWNDLVRGLGLLPIEAQWDGTLTDDQEAALMYYYDCLNWLVESARTLADVFGLPAPFADDGTPNLI